MHAYKLKQIAENKVLPVSETRNSLKLPSSEDAAALLQKLQFGKSVLSISRAALQSSPFEK